MIEESRTIKIDEPKTINIDNGATFRSAHPFLTWQLQPSGKCILGWYDQVTYEFTPITFKELAEQCKPGDWSDIMGYYMKTMEEHE